MRRSVVVTISMSSEKIEALSVDAQWVADKLSEFGFTMSS